MSRKRTPVSPINGTGGLCFFLIHWLQTCGSFPDFYCFMGLIVFPYVQSHCLGH